MLATFSSTMLIVDSNLKTRCDIRREWLANTKLMDVQVHQKPRREVSLQMLPMETLVMILEHLDLEDVLCVRRVSDSFCRNTSVLALT